MSAISFDPNQNGANARGVQLSNAFDSPYTIPILIIFAVLIYKAKK